MCFIKSCCVNRLLITVTIHKCFGRYFLMHFIRDTTLFITVSIEQKHWRFSHCVRCKQSRHVYSVEGDRKRGVKVQQKWIKGDFSTKRNIKAQTKAESKNEKYLEVSFFCTGQPQRIRPWWRRKKEKKCGLEMRQECTSTSLSFACKTRERLSCVPASNPTWTGAGAWEQFLGHALLSPCPLLPRCQEGETARREGRQEKKSQSRKIVLTVCAPTKDTKSPWNMHESTVSFL